MPVSTRSQIVGTPAAPASQDSRVPLLRNPHHGLKEKMKALTLLYEQHQKLAPKTQPQTLTLKDQEAHQEKKPILVPRTENQENILPESRIGMYNSCPKKPAVRRLSVGGKGGVMSEMAVKARRVVEKEEEGGSGSRIMVFVRLRPMGKKEKEGGARSCVRIVNRRDIYLTEFASETDYLRLKRVRGRHFCFDLSLSDSTTQKEVYSSTTANLVEGVLQGRNGTVFCYGATGAGKTYTMLGTVENPGVMVLAIKDLFSKIRQRSYDGNHSVHLSYLEVYNETVRDLLSPGRHLVLREDKQGIVAAGLTQYRAYSTDEVMALLQQGNMNRTTEPTRMNETSSRSHAILQVVAEYRVKDSSNVVTVVGKLSLIDLAGSERAIATDQRTQRSIEGANINRSLLALSSCINALVEGKKHIPYRNSKLTQLLKDSLGGSCNTVMIANISPSNLSFGETQNTLHWADRAKEIKTKACTKNEEVNSMADSETNQTKLVLELQEENSKLRQQLVRHQQKLLNLQAHSLASNSLSPPPTSSPIFLPSNSAPRKAKRAILAGNCFGTPPSSATAATIKALEADIERLKRNHAIQIKEKDEFIQKLMNSRTGVERQRIVTKVRAAELKSPSHRFTSPVPVAKKRSYWDIAGGSPLLGAGNGRKTRSHGPGTPPAPSMLLRPGFARRRTDTFR